MHIKKDDLLKTLPPEWPDDLQETITDLVQTAGVKLVVLDDDPTGTQTVYGIPVLTEWSVETLSQVFGEPETIVYILTNSRSVPLKDAQAMNREIAANLQAASQSTGRDFAVVSRSDSTLRGHYPGEVKALADSLGQGVDGTLIIPFFLEGGRLTINDTHYVTEDERLIPAAETEYARDASFGYQNSDLRAWVSEKHQGQIPVSAVASVPLNTLRTRGPEAVKTILKQVEGGQVCVVNAASYQDMAVFVAGLLAAEAEGKRFIYRTAASFVRVRGGLPARPLLTSADLKPDQNFKHHGGLIIAGSHIQKSSQQIEAVQKLPNLTSLEVSVLRLLDEGTKTDEIQRVIAAADQALSQDQEALIYTSRQLITGTNAGHSLEIGQTVSQALVDIVRGINIIPAWIIAKGGITSSDVATKGLDLKRAHVLGQAIPGVPIWQTGPNSRWPNRVYVVFPGNVGGPDAIAEMVQILKGQI